MKPPNPNQRHIEDVGNWFYCIDYGQRTLGFPDLKGALHWASLNMQTAPVPWMMPKHTNLDSYRVDL